MIAYDSKGTKYNSKSIHGHRTVSFKYDFTLIEVKEEMKTLIVDLPEADVDISTGTQGNVIGEYNIVRMDLDFRVKQAMEIVDRNHCNRPRPRKGLALLSPATKDAGFCARNLSINRCNFKNFDGPFVRNRTVFSLYGACISGNGNFLFESYVPYARDWIKNITGI